MGCSSRLSQPADVNSVEARFTCPRTRWQLPHLYPSQERGCPLSFRQHKYISGVDNWQDLDEPVLVYNWSHHPKKGAKDLWDIQVIITTVQPRHSGENTNSPSSQSSTISTTIADYRISSSLGSRSHIFENLKHPTRMDILVIKNQYSHEPVRSTMWRAQLWNTSNRTRLYQA